MGGVSHRAKPILEIDGQSVSEKLKEDILQISVEESLHLPGMFTIVVRNAYEPGHSEDEPWEHDKVFEIGKKVKIGFSSSTTDSEDFDNDNKGYVMEGEITAIEAYFTKGAEAPIIIRGYDASHRLHRGKYNRSFQNMTDKDIVSKIAGEVGIPTNKVDDTGAIDGYGDINGSNGYVFQNNQTNMNFLRERAARNGFECFVQDGKLNFRKPKSDESLELTWLQDFNSFRVRVNSAEQVKEVEVRGWDYSRKEAIVSNKSTDQVITKTEYGKGQKTSNAFQGQPPTPKMVVVDQTVFTSQEADKIAQALCNELGGNFVYADAKGEGNAQIRPGKVVKLSEMGKYNGEYYVTETRHLFQDRIYTTEFSVRGLKGRDLLETISPANGLQPGETPLIGIVTDNNDPNKWGRVRVKFPTLTEEHSSYWARVLSPGAGGGRGLDCLPEIDDEVMVIFENGDIHRPCVLGGVWNGKDNTPEGVGESVTDGKVRLRTFQTRTGHKLQFTEEDKGGSKKGMTLDTVYGHRIECNDSEKFIDIKTKSGHEIRMDDSSNTIEIKKSGTSITMQTQTGAITIKGNTITLDAKTITIKGSAAVSVTGGVIKLN